MTAAGDAGAELAATYERSVRERGLSADDAQRALVARLAALATLLSARSAPGRLRRLLAAGLPRWFALEAPRGIYLWGDVGRGKTWLMDLFYAHVRARAKRRQHFHHFMRDVHRRLARLDRRARPLEIIARQIANDTRLICLDELHVADIGDAMILHGLLTALLRRGVCLVITSNLPPAALYAGGLQRERFLPAIALLERQLDVVQLEGDTDYRLRHLRNAGTYQVGAAETTGPKLQALFEQLAGSERDAAGLQAGAIHVEGRHIPTLRAANGIAWFSFAALCEGPRSQNDYIEIARLLHTVFISDVPVFDGYRDDAARRFIALVDELYDHRVKLVIAAAAEPRELYRGERLKGDFERTVSRLIEMRSPEYLGREHSAALATPAAAR